MDGWVDINVFNDVQSMDVAFLRVWLFQHLTCLCVRNYFLWYKLVREWVSEECWETVFFFYLLLKALQHVCLICFLAGTKLSIKKNGQKPIKTQGCSSLSSSKTLIQNTFPKKPTVALLLSWRAVEPIRNVLFGALSRKQFPTAEHSV